jgi:hypothetical protein
MKKLLGLTGIIVCVFLIAACQPQDNQQEAPANGMVLTGGLSGNAFTIATGNEDEIMMDLIEAFNRMDAEALWASSADTISFHRSDGTVGPLTQADMAGFFSTVDSLSWDVDAVIPVQAQGSNRVSVLVDSRETLYMKDGTVDRMKLFERFIFEDGLLVGVRQWKAAMSPEDQSM